ncbi:MAG: DUF2130 domain-containing protein [Bacilli bacterium]|nr:DUF2130 domain-containing protein [Bacilli bacterium]
MNEIKCPECGKVFQIDETSYDSIVKQIRDHEFEKEIEIREKSFQSDKESAVKLAEANTKEKLNEEISKLKLEISSLQNKVEIADKEKESAIQTAVTKVENELNNKINTLEMDNNNLKNDLKLKESESKLTIEKALSEKDKTIDSLNNKIELSKKEFELTEKNNKESFQLELKKKDEMIEYYKDMKAKFSTKMVGESLEQYCDKAFNEIRTLFPNCEFGKDNDARTGSKGDFIFRDFDDEGNEVISIMFEMKNQNEETASKHKNTDFLKELDKDRKEKNCEYAVLVSLLELDNDLYNGGITDVSHIYPKMYIVRPQSFISIITLLRSAALKSIDIKKQLLIAQRTSVDITNFEDNLNEFKEGFARNYRLASDNFNKAIDEIDKTIDHLNKVRDSLVKSDNNLRLANKKSEDLSIKRLTSNAPSVREAFDNLKNNS